MSAVFGRTKLKDVLSSSLSSDLASNSANDEKLDLSSIGTDDIIEFFSDGSKSFQERKQYRDELCKRDRDLGREAITNICRSYEFSASKDLLAFICFLFSSGTLDLFEKLECCRTLHNTNYPSVRDYWLVVLHEFQSQPRESRVSISLYIDTLRVLMDGIFEEKVMDCVVWLCKECQPAFLYKTIVSIHKESETPDNSEYFPSRKISTDYLHFLYRTFFRSVDDDRNRILSAQYLLKNKIDETLVEEWLLFIMKNTSKSHQIRADAADTLMKLGSASSRDQSITILAEIGKDLTQLPTISANRENVHLFDSSVTEFLLKLGGIKLKTIRKDGIEQPQSFEDVADLIRSVPQYRESQKFEDAINSSLLRIKIDQVLYPGSQTLATIFLRIFQIIEQHKNKQLLLDRLIEELIDMADTCSSGHASRLVNVFSGIDGFFLAISWKDQITANLAGRLTSLVKKAEDFETRKIYFDEGIHLSPEQLEKIDGEFRARVLCEMLNTGVEQRIHWNRFFRTVIGPLMEEMKKEFVEAGHLTAEDFDLYLRQAVIFYETGIRE